MDALADLQENVVLERVRALQAAGVLTAGIRDAVQQGIATAAGDSSRSESRACER